MRRSCPAWCASGQLREPRQLLAELCAAGHEPQQRRQLPRSTRAPGQHRPTPGCSGNTGCNRRRTRHRHRRRRSATVYMRGPAGSPAMSGSGMESANGSSQVSASAGHDRHGFAFIHVELGVIGAQGSGNGPAYAAAPRPGPGRWNPMEEGSHCIAADTCRHQRHMTRLEPMPPERNAPSGTSVIIRTRTASRAAARPAPGCGSDQAGAGGQAGRSCAAAPVDRLFHRDFPPGPSLVDRMAPGASLRTPKKQRSVWPRHVPDLQHVDNAGHIHTGHGGMPDELPVS